MALQLSETGSMLPEKKPVLSPALVFPNPTHGDEAVACLFHDEAPQGQGLAS